jgi:hypothetical protein
MKKFQLQGEGDYCTYRKEDFENSDHVNPRHFPIPHDEIQKGFRRETEEFEDGTTKVRRVNQYQNGRMFTDYFIYDRSDEYPPSEFKGEETESNAKALNHVIDGGLIVIYMNGGTENLTEFLFEILETCMPFRVKIMHYDSNNKQWVPQYLPRYNEVDDTAHEVEIDW